MVKVLYSFLLVGTSAGAGLTLVVGWLNIQLFRRDHDRRRKSLGLLLLALAGQNSVLLFSLVDAGTSEPSVRAFLFAVTMALTTAALGWKAGQFAQDLAIEEALGDGKNPRGLWVQNTERRLTAEEKRNTTIEHYAAAEARKAEAVEQRVTDEEHRGEVTEGHE